MAVDENKVMVGHIGVETGDHASLGGAMVPAAQLVSRGYDGGSLVAETSADGHVTMVLTVESTLIEQYKNASSTAIQTRAHHRTLFHLYVVIMIVSVLTLVVLAGVTGLVTGW
jgi:hypothetical protein